MNGTFNNRPVAGLTVQLFRMSQEGAGIIASAQTDVDGKFVFKAVPGKGPYLILTRYRGVEYTSRPLRANGDASLVADVVVYETTSDRPAIFFPYRIVLVDRLGVGAISVREIMGVANPSSRTYLGEEIAPDSRVTLSLGIPKGAEGGTVLRGIASPALQDGRLMETAPLQPGAREIAFAYQVRYWGTKTSLRWILEEQTGSMDVFLPDQGVKLESNVLQSKPSGLIQDQRFQRVAGGNLRKGTAIQVTLTGLPANYGPLAPWLAALLALLLTATLAISLRTSRARTISPPPS